ncbi:dynein axonemal heavy chain 2 isoform X2 [Bacillus rossius redtenbacheri]|uniref:dynein axonemal heavy chain 2 isoform X2 n=1 Tax=Bacillus rossius redtenbacheri TaxID=93214 RepID=UPI002FDE00B4
MMGVHWANYVRKVDVVVDEALKLCTRSSLQVMLDKLNRGGSGDSSPLLDISVLLSDNKITFVPSLQEIGFVLRGIKHMIVHDLKELRRLHEIYNVPENGLRSYSDVVEDDDECNKLQQLINKEMTTNTEMIVEYAMTWDRYRTIWDVDMNYFLARYENVEPPLSSFDMDINRYAVTRSAVQLEENMVPMYFLMVHAGSLKQSIVVLCSEWEQRLANLLLRLTASRINNLSEYMRDNAARVNKEPETLKDLQDRIIYHNNLVQELPEKELILHSFEEYFNVLGKYEVQIPEEVSEKAGTLDDEWLQYLKALDEAKDMLDRSKERFRLALLEAVKALNARIEAQAEDFKTNAPFTSAWENKDAFGYLDNAKQQVTEMQMESEQLKTDLAFFGILLPESRALTKLQRDLEELEVVWDLKRQWDTAWEMYKTGSLWTVETEEMEQTVQQLFRDLSLLSRKLKDRQWEVVDHTRARVDAFRRMLPLVGNLKNPAMKPRHWTRVKQTVGSDFDENAEDFTLEKVIAMQMQDFADEIKEISNAATMELKIEEDLKVIADIWMKTVLDMVLIKDREVYRLKAVDDIFQTLDDHHLKLAAMKSTRFVEPFITEVNYWEKALTVVLEVLEMFLVVQRQFLYLDNIFQGEDIRKQLPLETSEFDQVTVQWKEITLRMYKDRGALTATHYPNLLATLNKLNKNLESIQRALEAYLETKRQIFPRFYFVSNDDLLEILAQSKRPENVQPHLRKCFDSINKLQIAKGAVSQKVEAVGMISAQDEEVGFSHPVVLEGPVELWLCQIENIMRVSLKEKLQLCRSDLRKNPEKRDVWAMYWPEQLCITTSQIQWTADCTRTLMQCKALESKKPLKRLWRKQNKVLNILLNCIRSPIANKMVRRKIKTLLTVGIHAREVITRMYRANTTDVTAFLWLAQLRFYWDRDINDCVIRQTNTYFVYGYEYLGIAGRLAITPLTDRCYITLTTALHMHWGGNPQGPAGTGKTETVKDLGRNLGRYVIVINCSEGLDYRSMGRMFSGLAQTGAWGCFDEFNRINIEVLSVVAQQVSSILTALAAKETKFVFEGVEISLVDTCGIFVTMNPGYAGRTELPDNLKSMFRPISMVVPDTALIADVTLFAEGFRDSKALAQKVDTMYMLAKQQFSKQHHYDFGLRGLVSLIRYAGSKRIATTTMSDEEVMLVAMIDMNLAKLTADDVPLFNGITSDLFPGVKAPEQDYSALIEATHWALKEAGLQIVSQVETKVIQLYETKNSRHSVMLIGQTGSGKTVTWKTLQSALTKMSKTPNSTETAVKVFPISPKALGLGDMYGEYNLATKEWSDGVLSAIMRIVCADESLVQKWILFDGPVDAVWIENMNSVMDDNKLLTLINGERIVMPMQVSLLFEVEDLAEASPATVSRCGMVYNDYKDLGWRPYVDSWLSRMADRGQPFVQEMEMLIDRYVSAILQFKRDNCSELTRVSELGSVVTLCMLLRSLATRENGVDPGGDQENFHTLAKLWFLFCLIWSICGTVDDASRTLIDTYFRDKETVFPLKDTVYEYFVDPTSHAMVAWESKLSDNWRYNKALPFFKILVPTVDTVRYPYLVSALLLNSVPVLLTGPVGTGKTSHVQMVIDSLDDTKYSVLIVNMSAQTSSNNVQDIIESRVEKRTKGNYYPPGGKKLVTFLDDLNMPAKEIYGAQPPLELIRQWVDYGFWYDRQNQSETNVKDMLLLAAMGPPGGGRTVISGRLVSRFAVINVTFPRDAQIVRIFGTLLAQHLMDFDEELKMINQNITEATLDLFTAVCQHLLPTPSKTHYLFNLRDISKVFQGLLRSHADYQNNKQAMLRLWVHECFRVFSDRLIDTKDRDWFKKQIGEVVNRNFQLTFQALCPEEEPPVFCHLVNTDGVYEDLPDLAALRGFLETQLEEYNSSPGTLPMDLVLFKEAVQHVCRVVRVVSQPRGHMLLIGVGGSGRQSLARLAVYLCNYLFFEVEVTRNYRLPEFKEDLKLLYRKTGVDNHATTFLFNDTQVTQDAFLEVVSNLMNTGEVANLYKAEEFEEVKGALSIAATKAGILPTNEAIFNFLVDRVRTNLHVVLCMSPLEERFRDFLRQYPALVNTTTIDWFSDWNEIALLEVAHKFLVDVDFLQTIDMPQGNPRPREFEKIQAQEKVRTAVAEVFARIHSSVSEYSRKMMEEMKRPNHVVPTNYLELVTGYMKMLEEKRLSNINAANKLKGGVFRIDETKKAVGVMKVTLEESKVKADKERQELDIVLKNIANSTKLVEDKAKIVATRQARIATEEVQLKKDAAVAQRELDKAMPILLQAELALGDVSKKDLAEVRSYARPAVEVEKVMEAVMILMRLEPSWAEARRQLGDVDFLNKLRNYEKGTVTESMLRKIASYTARKELEPENVAKKSKAAKSLMEWVLAMENYSKIDIVVAPKRQKLAAAMEELAKKQEELAKSQAELAAENAKLELLAEEQRLKQQELKKHEKEARELQRKLEMAEQLLIELGGERERWEQTLHRLSKQFVFLPGDCLLATGFVSYVGPFVSHYRQQLLSLWKTKVVELEVPLSAEFRLEDFLCDPTTIREWNIQGLPSDGFSTENGIIVTGCSRWPLLIDPQSQGVKWIKNMEGEKDLKIIDFGQSDFMKTLENAVQYGHSVLLQNVVDVFDPAITPILKKAVIRQGGQDLIKLGDKMVQYNPKFRFFITTKLRNPYYSPEITTKTTVVNFAVKEQGLEAQLLGIVVRKERPVLEEEKDKLVVDIANGKRYLLNLEDELLSLLSKVDGSLLDDDLLLETLRASKSTAISVAKQLEVSVATEAEINEARESYRPCARRASILFFVLDDLSGIDPMYRFSLDVYISLFTISLEKSQPSSVLEERISNLNEFHTYAVYRNICRGLFERHKLLFSFHMCVKILYAQGSMNLDEYNFLLSGGVVVDRAEQPPNPCPAWLPEDAWDNITELNKLPGFGGVTSSFEQYPRDWQLWFIDKEPEKQPLIGEWKDVCTEFQRMLLVRSLRVDRITFSVYMFVTSNMGQRFVEPPGLDINTVFEESTPQSPLLFLLSPGVDPTGMLTQLAQARDMSARFTSLSLGQGQSPIATRMISSGIKDGLWVFLANCHLSLTWLPELATLVDNLQTHGIHPDFRLWLSSTPFDKFPVSILQASIKMTTEAPEGVRANMTRLYKSITNKQFEACKAHAKYIRLLFSLCFFHSVLVERRKFGQLGWNVGYHFTDNDFLVSEKLLSIYLDEYAETPWDALKYLISGVNYGGHVTDEWDRRVLDTYINRFFNDDLLTINNYRLSVLPTYFVPRDGTLQSYRDYISFLPAMDQPETFGQHPNADIAYLKEEAKSVFESLMNMQATTAIGGSVSKEDKVMQLAKDILARIPQPIDSKAADSVERTQRSPLLVVLLQEISRYNQLLVQVSTSIEELQRAILGLVVMSSDLDAVFKSIFEGQVPVNWTTAYPTKKPLGSWTRDLVLRVEFFAAWAKTLEAPLLFWLGAFTFPTSFLSAVKQTVARALNVSIDALSWEFIVNTDDEDDSVVEADEAGGVHVRGIFLEAAGWDRQSACLTEPQPMQLLCPMPVVLFRPVAGRRTRRRRGMYVCPCFSYPFRSMTSFVVAVDLKSGANKPDHWIKRATALLLSLAT